MTDLLVEAKKTIEAAGTAGLSGAQLRSLRGRYTRILNLGLAVNPEPADSRKRDASSASRGTCFGASMPNAPTRSGTGPTRSTLNPRDAA